MLDILVNYKRNYEVEESTKSNFNCKTRFKFNTEKLSELIAQKNFNGFYLVKAEEISGELGCYIYYDNESQILLNESMYNLDHTIADHEFYHLCTNSRFDMPQSCAYFSRGIEESLARIYQQCQFIDEIKIEKLKNRCNLVSDMVTFNDLYEKTDCKKYENILCESLYSPNTVYNSIMEVYSNILQRSDLYPKDSDNISFFLRECLLCLLNLDTYILENFQASDPTCTRMHNIMNKINILCYSLLRDSWHNKKAEYLLEKYKYNNLDNESIIYELIDLSNSFREIAIPKIKSIVLNN